jgi:hypothetical protein
MSADLEILCSIPTAARKAGCSRRAMFRRVLALYVADTENGGTCTWLLRPGPGRAMRINLSRLEAEHPQMFRRRAATRDEVEETHARLSEVERLRSEDRRHANGQGARIRELERWRGDVERRLKVIERVGA